MTGESRPHIDDPEDQLTDRVEASETAARLFPGPEVARRQSEIARGILDRVPDLDTSGDDRPTTEIVRFLIEIGTIDAALAQDAGLELETPGPEIVYEPLEVVWQRGN